MFKYRTCGGFPRCYICKCHSIHLFAIATRSLLFRSSLWDAYHHAGRCQLRQHGRGDHPAAIAPATTNFSLNVYFAAELDFVLASIHAVLEAKRNAALTHHVWEGPPHAAMQRDLANNSSNFEDPLQRAEGEIHSSRLHVEVAVRPGAPQPHWPWEGLQAVPADVKDDIPPPLPPPQAQNQHVVLHPAVWRDHLSSRYLTSHKETPVASDPILGSRSGMCIVAAV